jgi:hypothetical protein
VSEEKMIEMMQQALTTRGINETLLAVGQFNPRGHIGGVIGGGMIGSEVGGLLGGVGEVVGVGAGTVAGMHIADGRSGLPTRMLVGVSTNSVFGFAGHTSSEPPTDLLFQLPRAGLTIKVHKRVNVRILELEDTANGTRIELEGNRLPLTHSRDVIDELKE